MPKSEAKAASRQTRLKVAKNATVASTKLLSSNLSGSKGKKAGANHPASVLQIRKITQAINIAAQDTSTPTPRYIILAGPPGCGKRTAVQAICEFEDWPLDSVDIDHMWRRLWKNEREEDEREPRTYSLEKRHNRALNDLIVALEGRAREPPAVDHHRPLISWEEVPGEFLGRRKLLQFLARLNYQWVGPPVVFILRLTLDSNVQQQTYLDLKMSRDGADYGVTLVSMQAVCDTSMGPFIKSQLMIGGEKFKNTERIVEWIKSEAHGDFRQAAIKIAEMRQCSDFDPARNVKAEQPDIKLDRFQFATRVLRGKRVSWDEVRKIGALSADGYTDLGKARQAAKELPPDVPSFHNSLQSLLYFQVQPFLHLASVESAAPAYYDPGLRAKESQWGPMIEVLEEDAREKGLLLPQALRGFKPIWAPQNYTKVMSERKSSVKKKGELIEAGDSELVYHLYFPPTTFSMRDEICLLGEDALRGVIQSVTSAVPHYFKDIEDLAVASAEISMSSFMDVGRWMHKWNANDPFAIDTATCLLQGVHGALRRRPERIGDISKSYSGSSAYFWRQKAERFRMFVGYLWEDMIDKGESVIQEKPLRNLRLFQDILPSLQITGNEERHHPSIQLLLSKPQDGLDEMLMEGLDDYEEEDYEPIES